LAGLCQPPPIVVDLSGSWMILPLVRACRTAVRHSRKMDKAAVHQPAGNANVCTSKATARDFCAHTARTNSSRLGRTAGDPFRLFSRFGDETRAGKFRPAAARSGRE